MENKHPETKKAEPVDARKIFVRKEIFDMIASGEKTLELRVAFGSFRAISIDEKILFSSGSGEEVSTKVTDTRFYRNIADVSGGEDLNKLLPGISAEKAAELAKQFFSDDDIEKHGLVILEFEISE